MNKSRKFVLLKPRLQKKYFKGSIHRGLIIRSKVNFKRLNGVYIRFGENTVVLVTKNVVPVSIEFLVQYCVKCVCVDLL